MWWKSVSHFQVIYLKTQLCGILANNVVFKVWMLNYTVNIHRNRIAQDLALMNKQQTNEPIIK